MASRRRPPARNILRYVKRHEAAARLRLARLERVAVTIENRELRIGLRELKRDLKEMGSWIHIIC